MKTYKEYENKLDHIDSLCEDMKYDDLVVEEIEHQGKKVKLNNPTRTPGGPGKFAVYVKRDSEARRKSFRARHNCENPGPKWKARYWSCYQWRAGAKVDN